MLTAWLTELRDIFEKSKSVDWENHTRQLNFRLGLSGDDALCPSFQGLPPFWFNGDVEALRPGEWTLVMSLNHQLPGGQEEVSRETMWEFCRTHNTRYWYTRFFRPLVTLASTALDHDVANEQEYASNQMVFVELCPYASPRFQLTPDQVAELADTDLGCRMEARIAQLLLAEAEPALVLLNGSHTISSFETIHCGELKGWEQRSYPSVQAHGRMRWHKHGFIATPAGRRPVVGFPFLRTMSTANSNAEIRQLGLLAREFIDNLRA